MSQEIIFGQVMGPIGTPAYRIFIECKVCLKIKEGEIKRGLYSKREVDVRTMCNYFSFNERMMAEYYCNDHGKALMIRQAIEHAEKKERGE